MNFVKNLMVVLAIAVLGLLGACGKTPEPVVHKIPVPTAEQQWLRAEQQLTTAAKNYVRINDVRDAKNCDVKTAELASSPALYEFPIAGDRAYKAACKAEIQAQANKRAQTYAKGRTDERKIAAKKAKQAEIAAKTAKKRHASTLQPVRPAAKSVAAQRPAT